MASSGINFNSKYKILRSTQICEPRLQRLEPWTHWASLDGDPQVTEAPPLLLTRTVQKSSDADSAAWGESNNTLASFDSLTFRLHKRARPDRPEGEFTTVLKQTQSWKELIVYSYCKILPLWVRWFIFHVLAFRALVIKLKTKGTWKFY